MKTILSLLLFCPLFCAGQFIYHVPPPDFKQLPVGTTILNDYLITNRGTWVTKPLQVTPQNCMDSARKYRMKMILTANGTFPYEPVFMDDTTLFGYSSYDEISGTIVEKGLYSKNWMRDKTSKPIIVSQNNFLRLAETSMVCDILLPDPYVTPNVALKQVYIVAREACKYGKPVWIALNQYDKKQPTFEELRCQIYLALVGGANNIGIFEQDHREYNSATKTLSGWYLPDSANKWAFTKSLLFEIAALRPYMAAGCEPIPTGVSGVYAAKRGGKTWIVNSTRNTVYAMGLILEAMEVREIN